MSDPIARLNVSLEGRYHVESLLGEGGMARVYLAVDVKHDRRVALKVLKPELGEALGTARFQREIDIVSKLSHPHILPLFDSGEADGLFYLVMPYVEGESLRDRLDRDGSLSLEQAVTVTSEIADALGYAHERGLVHRDVKPENILFQSGHAAITDFGIAVAISGDANTRLTRTGTAPGTLAYMSPEQAAGDSEVDARSDVYALGCILFEMIEGRRPFAGRNPQAVLASKLAGRPPELNASRELPETLQPVLDRALATDPGDRPRDARQFTTELRAALTDVEIEAARARRQRRVLFRGAGAIAGATLLGISAWWVAGVLTGPEIERVAFLPFANEQADPERASVLAGMHEALIAEMQQAGLEVIGRRSVIRYLGDTTPIAEIARQLGVDAVLEGRAEYGEDSVTMSLTMTDGRTEAARWNGSFAGAKRNAIALYRETTEAIAEAVGLDLTEEVATRLAAVSDVDPESFELTLRGNYHWSRLTPQDLEIAQGLYERALEIDPDNALALGGLAKVWAGRQQFGLVSPTEARPLVWDYLRRALRLAPDEPDLVALHAGVLTWLEWDWDAAVPEYRRALDLNPNNWEARAYFSQLLAYVGRPDEARAQSAMARAGDPFNGLVLGVALGAVAMVGDYETALEAAREALRLDPSQPVAHDVVTYSLRALGRMEEAVHQEAELFTALGDTALANGLLRGLEDGGPRSASARAAEILEARAEVTFVAPSRIALAHLYAGDLERSLHWMERAVEIRDPVMPGVLSGLDMPEVLRADPRFQAILARTELTTRSAVQGGQ